MKRGSVRLAVTGIAIAAMGASLFAAAPAVQAQSSRHLPKPVRREGMRLCTVMDGNPYSVVIERGTCGMGEVEVTGGGDGGAASVGPNGGALAAHCQTQYSTRLAICNAIPNSGRRAACVSNANVNYQQCMNSAVQTPFPY